MAKHTKTARQVAKEKLNARIRKERERTGYGFKQKPPRPISRGGTSSAPKPTPKRKASVSVKPKGVIDVLRGDTARKREKKATQPRKRR